METSFKYSMEKILAKTNSKCIRIYSTVYLRSIKVNVVLSLSVQITDSILHAFVFLIIQRSQFELQTQNQDCKYILLLLSFP